MSSEEREKAQAQLKAEEEAEDRSSNTKEEIQVGRDRKDNDFSLQIAADHASKMTAKWEKIQKKEAKKAEKSKMPTKAGTGVGFYL